MKYVITGSLGHISKPLAKRLVAAGHEVDIITRDPEKAGAIRELGAKPRVGSVDDVAFLKEAFAGADAVYTMIPPHFGASDWKQYIASIGKNYADALRGSGVHHVVNLSSIGADQSKGCGPVSGLYYVEKALSEVDGVNVLHLRPGFFYYNFLSNIAMVQNMGIIGGNYGQGTRLVLADPSDIAEAAANALLGLSFKSNDVLYVASDEKSVDEVASVLGTAIGKPELKWVDFTDDQTREAMIQAGLPAEVAANYTEMGAALREGRMSADYFAKGVKPQGKVKLNEFSKTFAQVYNQNATAKA